MDIQPGQYLEQLKDRSFFPLLARDASTMIQGIAEAGYLYPIEALGTSIILGVLGTFFGGIVFTPVLLFTASLLGMAPFCRETNIFIDRFKQEWNYQPAFDEQTQELRPHGLEQRKELVKELRNDPEYVRNVMSTFQLGVLNSAVTERAAIKVQSVVRGHQSRSLFKRMFGKD